MKKYSITLLIAIMLFGCSFKTAPNEWQYKSADAFSSYVKNFMQGEDVLAKNDLKRAVKHAKKSADLTSLARVYLGKCALNISVGIADRCDEYKKISNLVDDEELFKYYTIITKTSTQNPNDILDPNRVTSVLLNGALKKDSLTNAERAHMLDISSFNGYKKAVLFWLKESKRDSNKKAQKDFFQHKIEVLMYRDY